MLAACFIVPIKDLRKLSTLLWLYGCPPDSFLTVAPAVRDSSSDCFVWAHTASSCDGAGCSCVFSGGASSGKSTWIKNVAP